MDEEIGGERFTLVEPTPSLLACIEQARRALEAGGARVLTREPWQFGPTTRLTPTLMAWSQSRLSAEPEDGGPGLVVEFRTESTSRYVLGPKRMAYARHAVPELWMVDPFHHRVAVLQADPHGEFSWPPTVRGAHESLVPVALSQVRVAVTDLLSGWPANRVREPDDAAEPFYER